MKTVDEITIADLVDSPVWEYGANEPFYEAQLNPVLNLPVSHLENRIVGTRILLRNGQRCWATIGNIDLDDLRLTQQVLTLSVERKGEWFYLPRYHDVEYPRRGPEQLAQFLGLSIEQIFPIRFDISSVVVGCEEVTRGEILLEPKERLSKDQLLELIIERGKRWAQEHGFMEDQGPEK